MDDAEQAARAREGPEPEAPAAARAEQSPPGFRPLRLLLQPSGPFLELTRPDMLIGRHSEADIRLPLPDVSRRHCRFLFTDDVWQVFDLDSLNGVFVNGERVRHAILRHQDILTIGGFQFEVHLQGESSSSELPGNAQEIIHRIADALPRSAADIPSQRKAS